MARYDESIELMNKSQAILISIYGEKHAYIGISYRNIGDIHKATGNPDMALECYMKSREILASIYGDDHSLVVSVDNLISELNNAE